MGTRLYLLLTLIIGGFSVGSLSGCASVFVVKSDPLQADVFYLDPKTGDKKPLGKTPLELPTAALKKLVGDQVVAGEYFTVTLEKQGFISEKYQIPATRFGTLVTTLDAKLKTGNAPKEEHLARDILNHLFLAQELANAHQYERAQIELDKLLADAPDFARALSMRASIYYVQKKYSESLKWYEEALKADPQMQNVVQMVAKVRATLGLGQGTRVPASSPKGGKP